LVRTSYNECTCKAYHCLVASSKSGCRKPQERRASRCQVQRQITAAAIIGATTLVYGTRGSGTRPLQLWRSWGPSVFGPLQLF